MKFPEAFKGELRSLGFIENNKYHVLSGVHKEQKYGVDFKTGEIFRFEELERITEDESDVFLNKLKDIAQRTIESRWGQ